MAMSFRSTSAFKTRLFHPARSVVAIPTAAVLTLAALTVGNVSAQTRFVEAWGWNEEGECNVPAGLTNVIALSAGSDCSVALKSDHTVVAWGNNDIGQATVPAGLANVTRI